MDNTLASSCLSLLAIHVSNPGQGMWLGSGRLSMRKTCPCNVYPLIPHCHMVKVRYEGVYLFFLFLLQNIDYGYSLEPPGQGGSNMYPQSMF